MKKFLLFLFITVFIVFNSCKKNSDFDVVNYGSDINTWTFTEGSNVFRGSLHFDAALDTVLQSNNSYGLLLIGPEKNSGNIFSILLSLLDLNFTTRTYQTGIGGNGYLSLFDFRGQNVIYESSNLNPGPVMTFNITAYDAAKDIVTMTFSGQAGLANGNYVSISNGKVTAKIVRQ